MRLERADDVVHRRPSVLGRAPDRGSLLAAIAAVANVPAEYDDRIVAKYGGQTALDRIRDTGGKRGRSERPRREALHPPRS